MNEHTSWLSSIMGIESHFGYSSGSYAVNLSEPYLAHTKNLVCHTNPKLPDVCRIRGMVSRFANPSKKSPKKWEAFQINRTYNYSEYLYFLGYHTPETIQIFYIFKIWIKSGHIATLLLMQSRGSNCGLMCTWEFLRTPSGQIQQQ